MAARGASRQHNHRGARRRSTGLAPPGRRRPSPSADTEYRDPRAMVTRAGPPPRPIESNGAAPRQGAPALRRPAAAAGRCGHSGLARPSAQQPRHKRTRHREITNRRAVRILMPCAWPVRYFRPQACMGIISIGRATSFGSIPCRYSRLIRGDMRCSCVISLIISELIFPCYSLFKALRS